MDSQTIVTIVTTITAAVVTIVGLILKDKADERRWRDGRERADARHAEVASTLGKVEQEVNGKMSQLADARLAEGYAKGLAEGRDIVLKEGC